MSKFRRQLMMANTGAAPVPPGPVLPYDAEIEYLQSNGTQWIDTNYIPQTSTLEFEIKYQINAVTSSAGSMFGSRKYNGSHYDIIQILTYQSGSRRYRFDYNTTATNLQNYDANVHILKFSGGRLYLDGTQISSVTLSTFDALKIFVFATNQNGEATLIHQGYKLYFFKFGALDLIPVRVGQVGYMYDRESKQLFGNSGTGDFVLGQDIVEVEYLESDGTQYIDTGYIPNIETSYKIDFELLETTNQASNICGCRDSATSNNIATFFDASYVSCDFGNYNGTRLNVSCSIGRYVCENRKNYRKINNTSNSNVYSGVINASKSFYIFQNNGTTFANKRMRVYSFYMTDGIKTLDLIPVRVGTTGYLLDKIEHRLYGNAGTGSFILGNDKN